MSITQRYWTASTLQGRRWMMERRLEAVEENNTEKLQQLLEVQGRNKPRELTSALEIALRKRSDEYASCVRLLLKHGADPNGKNGSGTPFLHLAADSGCHEIVKVFLEYNCSLQQSREDGASALHRAAWRGHMRCMHMLMEAGADVNARDAMGRTPLVTASQGNNQNCVMLLANNGSEVNALDNNNMGLLAWGTHYNNMEFVALALSHAGVNHAINAQDPKGRTPLHIAALNENLHILEVLLKHNPNLNIRDAKCRTPLHITAKNGALLCSHHLIQRGSDVNIQDDDHATPLVYLVDISDLVEALLNADAYPNLKTLSNVTPLWLCSKYNYDKSAKLLLQANADANVMAGIEDNKLPLQVALYEGHVGIAKMIFTACIAMATPVSWLSSYMDDQNFQQQALINENVHRACTWIRDVMKNQPINAPRSLQSWTRICLRTRVGPGRIWQKLGQLELPARLRDYLRLRDLEDYLSES